MLIVGKGGFGNNIIKQICIKKQWEDLKKN